MRIPLVQPAIGLDIKTLSLEYAGIGRYTINLVHELTKRKRYSYLGFSSPRTNVELIPSDNIHISKGISSYVNSTLLRSLLLLPIQVWNQKLDIFHSMDNSIINLLPKSKCKRLSTIHDLIALKYPEFFTRKHRTVVHNMISYVARNADHIITDSSSTKMDLLEFYPFLEDQDISVVHLASSDFFRKCSEDQISRMLSKLSLPDRYFLSLATNEPRKNVKSIIDAFRIFRKNAAFNDIGLVLVGGKGWLNTGVEGDRETLKNEHIYSFGFLSDDMLPPLYSGALAFVYPSFYEGFGLPVLEAMSCGCPIITSNVSSLPEIAGDSAIYIDAHSIDSIKNALSALANDLEHRASLSLDVLRKSKEFSWEKTAEKTEAVYNKLLG
jgi:glycosyltransferase involved in cell wall biosynthesis